MVIVVSEETGDDLGRARRRDDRAARRAAPARRAARRLSRGGATREALDGRARDGAEAGREPAPARRADAQPRAAERRCAGSREPRLHSCSPCAIAIVLWGVAHGSSSIERGFDIPVVLRRHPRRPRDRRTRARDAVNVRVLGQPRRAAQRRRRPTSSTAVDVSGAKPGVAQRTRSTPTPIDAAARRADREPLARRSLEVTLARRGSQVRARARRPRRASRPAGFARGRGRGRSAPRPAHRRAVARCSGCARC